jgi:hypothetical protein
LRRPSWVRFVMMALLISRSVRQRSSLLGVVGSAEDGRSFEARRVE